MDPEEQNTADLEKAWKEEQLKMFPRNEAEYIQLFSDAKERILEILEELQEERIKLISLIKDKLKDNKRKYAPEDQWFGREVIKSQEGWDLIKIEREISRRQVSLLVSVGRELKGRISEEKIKQASSVPISIIAEQAGIKLKKSGRNLFGLCPFHNEKHPSFYIYPDTNSFYCFGCQKGNNVIKFVEMLYNYSFKEAVEFLINHK